jgi:ankyrin repeat protein
MTIGTGDPVVFFSDSQGADRVPWAVQIQGVRYVIPSDAPARAFDLVRAYMPRAPMPVEPGGRRGASDLERPKPAVPEVEALGRAVEQGDVAAVRRLLSSGADVNGPLDRGATTPLVAAARRRQAEMAGVLLSAGADPFGVTSFDEDALSAAVNAGADDVLSLLVDAGHRARAERSRYRRAMVAAAGSGRVKPLRLLLAAGADPERGDDKSGESPLHYAAAGGQTEIVRLLIEAGARPDVPDHRGFPPLVEAARNGHEDAVRELLNHGARSGLQDALEAAAVAGTWESRLPTAQPVAALKNVVRMLLAAGADPQAKMWDGRTVMGVLESMSQARGREMLAVIREGARH